MGGFEEKYFAYTRRERKKKIARLQQVICEHLPSGIENKDFVAKSISEHAFNFSHNLFITTKTMKGLKELPKQAHRNMLEYVAAFEKFTTSIDASILDLEKSIEACDIPLSHINDAMTVFAHLEMQFREAVDGINKSEANRPRTKQGRSKAGAAIFTISIDEFLTEYSLPRKRRARIITTLILHIQKKEVTKLEHKKLVSNIEQIIRNAEI